MPLLPLGSGEKVTLADRVYGQYTPTQELTCSECIDSPCVTVQPTMTLDNCTHMCSAESQCVGIVFATDVKGKGLNACARCRNMAPKTIPSVLVYRPFYKWHYAGEEACSAWCPANVGTLCNEEAYAAISADSISHIALEAGVLQGRYWEFYSPMANFESQWGGPMCNTGNNLCLYSTNPGEGEHDRCNVPSLTAGKRRLCPCDTRSDHDNRKHLTDFLAFQKRPVVPSTKESCLLLCSEQGTKYTMRSHTVAHDTCFCFNHTFARGLDTSNNAFVADAAYQWTGEVVVQGNHSGAVSLAAQEFDVLNQTYLVGESGADFNFGKVLPSADGYTVCLISRNTVLKDSAANWVMDSSEKMAQLSTTEPAWNYSSPVDLCMRKGVFLYGERVGDAFPATDAGSCMATCAQSPACVAWMFYEGSCNLLSSVSNTGKMPGATSGLQSCDTDVIVPDMNSDACWHWPGSETSNNSRPETTSGHAEMAPVQPNAHACRSQCMLQSDCLYFLWNINTGRCALLSANPLYDPALFPVVETVWGPRICATSVRLEGPLVSTQNKNWTTLCANSEGAVSLDAIVVQEARALTALPNVSQSSVEPRLVPRWEIMDLVVWDRALSSDDMQASSAALMREHGMHTPLGLGLLGATAPTTPATVSDTSDRRYVVGVHTGNCGFEGLDNPNIGQSVGGGGTVAVVTTTTAQLSASIDYHFDACPKTDLSSALAICANASQCVGVTCFCPLRIGENCGECILGMGVNSTHKTVALPGNTSLYSVIFRNRPTILNTTTPLHAEYGSQSSRRSDAPLTLATDHFVYGCVLAGKHEQDIVTDASCTRAQCLAVFDTGTNAAHRLRSVLGAPLNATLKHGLQETEAPMFGCSAQLVHNGTEIQVYWANSVASVSTNAHLMKNTAAFCPGKDLTFRSSAPPSDLYTGIIVQQSSQPCNGQWISIRADMCAKRAATTGGWEFYPSRGVLECTQASPGAVNGEIADPFADSPFYSAVLTWLCGYALTGAHYYGVGTVYDSSHVNSMSADCTAVSFSVVEHAYRLIHVPDLASAVPLQLPAPLARHAPVDCTIYPQRYCQGPHPTIYHGIGSPETCQQMCGVGCNGGHHDANSNTCYLYFGTDVCTLGPDLVGWTTAFSCITFAPTHAPTSRSVVKYGCVHRSRNTGRHDGSLPQGQRFTLPNKDVGGYNGWLVRESAVPCDSISPTGTWLSIDNALCIDPVAQEASQVCSEHSYIRPKDLIHHMCSWALASIRMSYASDASLAPTKAPTAGPTMAPTSAPSTSPTTNPTGAPSDPPTFFGAPSKAPTFSPSAPPTLAPTVPTMQLTATGLPVHGIQTCQQHGQTRTENHYRDSGYAANRDCTTVIGLATVLGSMEILKIR